MYSLSKASGVLLLSGGLILFSQFSAGIAITTGTIIGVILTLLICLSGVVLHKLLPQLRYPLLGWVSTLALLLCLPESPVYNLLQKYLMQLIFIL
jgi:hypothetical protein